MDEGKPGDCNYFLNKCSELCNYNVLIAQCWGDPLYAYCKATDGSVFHIPGFTCEHLLVLLMLNKNDNEKENKCNHEAAFNTSAT